MNRSESIIIGVFLGVACPLLGFVLFWWTTAGVHLFVIDIPENVIIIAALAGLALGVVLDIVFIKRWVKGFYSANIWLVIALYLGLCLVAVAFFMGLPVGTFALGVAAGVYAGRRQRHTGSDGLPVTSSVRRAAFLAAAVTTAAAVPIGYFALREPNVLQLLETITGLNEALLRGLPGLTVIGVLCVVLFLCQYWCSKQAGLLAFRIGGSHGRERKGVTRQAPHRA